MSAEEVETILSWLGQSNAKIASNEIDSKLLRLKEVTRTKGYAKPLYNAASFAIIYKWAFDRSETSNKAADEAKRCLANALTLEDSCVSIFLDTKGLAALFHSDDLSLETCSFEDEFLYARILFLVTGKRGQEIRKELIQFEKSLTSVLSAWLTRHLSWTADKDCNVSQTSFEAQKVVALIETLKLCFNISLFYPEILRKALTIRSNNNAEDFILSLLSNTRGHPQEQARTAVPHMVNLLTTLGTKEHNSNELSVYIPLCTLLHEYVNAMLHDSAWNGVLITQDQMVPLLTVLSDIFVSYKDNADSAEQFKTFFLVAQEERTVSLGQSDSAQAKLLRLLNSSTPEIRDCLGTFLFQLSDSSPSQFCLNVGYGHAIGFLTSKGIALPPENIPASSNGEAINPITGQNLRDEAAVQAQMQLPEMTDEEKEREAERLFVLFERLKKNGIIDVENPIQQAVQEGRFQEM